MGSARDRANGRNLVAKHLRSGGEVRADTAAAFTEYLRRFGTVLSDRNTAVVTSFTNELFTSIVDGSIVTGAPPLPVATGALKSSYAITQEGPATFRIHSSDIAALAVEYHWRGAKYRNGGPHGRAITVAGAPRLLAMVTREVVG